MAGIAALAYRNGHGGVTLGITTEKGRCSRRNWELVLADPRDADWYNQDADPEVLRDKWYKMVVFDVTTIDPVTTSANNATWHLARRYAMTSSTADIGKNCLRRVKTADHGACGINTACLQTVTAYLGMFKEDDSEGGQVSDIRVAEIEAKVDKMFDEQESEAEITEFRKVLKHYVGEKRPFTVWVARNGSVSQI